MKKYAYLLLTLLIPAFVMVGCDDGNTEDGDKQIEISNLSEAVQQGYADDATTGGFTFTAKSSWTATVSEKSRASGVSWLRLLLDGTETYSGDAGTFTLTIEIDANYTGETRSATITVTSGSHSITVTVTQNGQTKGGEVPEKPKLITRIQETTATSNSVYFDLYDQPDYYEFKYNEQDLLTQITVRDHSGSESEKLTYSYDVSKEISIYVDNSARYKAILNNDGSVKHIYDTYSSEPATLTYTDGYLTHVSGLYDTYTNYIYVWTGDNLSGRKMYTEDQNPEDAEPIKNPNVYSNDLNNKANLDLNIFFFGLHSDTYRSGYEDHYNLFALTGNTGKRSKNFLLKEGGEEGSVGQERFRHVYTESSEPEIGVLSTSVSQMVNEDSRKYSFDNDGYPVSYSFDAEIIKYVITYSGERQYVTPESEEEEHFWLTNFGEGPWFTLKTDTTTSKSNDTYTYTISYNK